MNSKYLQAACLALVAMLSGCATTAPVIVETPNVRVPPQDAMRECEPLTPFTGDDGAELTGMLTVWGREHSIVCGGRHHALIEWVRNGMPKP